MYVKWLWVEVVVWCVYVCMRVCMCACVCMCLFTCVCAWVKGTTKKEGGNKGKVNLEKKVPTMDLNL